MNSFYQNNKCCGNAEPRKNDFEVIRENRLEERFECEKHESEKQYDKREDLREEKLKNRSSIQVEACGKKHKIESNEVEARKINLTVREEQNCDCVFAGDEVGYKVRIYNDSHVAVRNVEFVDTFSECGRYKKGSFEINGRKENPHADDHCIRFNIDEIKPHQEVLICFEIYFK